MDTDSEEDSEIDASAILTSGGLNVKYQAFPAKRLKTQHSKEQSTDDITAITMEAAIVVDSPHEKRKNQVQISSSGFC